MLRGGAVLYDQSWNKMFIVLGKEARRVCDGWMRGINATVSRRANSDFAGGPQGPRKRMQYRRRLKRGVLRDLQDGLSRQGTKAVGQVAPLVTVSQVRVCAPPAIAG